MIRLALIFACLPFASFADTKATTKANEDAEKQTIEACLTHADYPEACIGRAAEDCRALDLGAANPIQQDGWCDGAETEVWEKRLKDSTAVQLGLLKGSAPGGFQNQQKDWERLDQGNFPYDRVARFWPVGYIGLRRHLQLVASRALRVEDTVGLAQECLDADSSFRVPAFCADVKGAP